MKLVRYGKPGKEKPGLIDSAGRLRDLSAVVADIGPDQLGDAALARLRKLKTDTLPLVKGSPRMGCPVAGIGKFIAIGLNYADHAAEAAHLFPRQVVLRVVRQARVMHAGHARVLPQPVGDRQRVGVVPLHAQGQCRRAAQEQEGVERA